MFLIWERRAIGLDCNLRPRYSFSSTSLKLAAFSGVVLNPTELFYDCDISLDVLCALGGVLDLLEDLTHRRLP